MDAYGHVNNTEYLAYLEEARIALLFQGAADAGVTTLLGQVVVVRHEIDYRRPLEFRPEPILIDTWVTGIRNTSFSLGYDVRDENTLYATAATVMAAYDAAAEATRPLSERERSWLETLRDDEA
ncbi:thioesterase family protein [Actinopolymorpha pittospori]|uniref:Acyl-CoA thioester hydrolase n=2 Tax=Actinopolymorpha pittospori TaxID=648752 RepID=A0A927MQV4_9ACTN|nr:thioesterase family protein [Actinopolymorpha pittospori]MBE1604552.1 acyl-CoA thioester hydrolase [Actinopolymorpha pittospori]